MTINWVSWETDSSLYRVVTAESLLVTNGTMQYSTLLISVVKGRRELEKKLVTKLFTL